MRYLTGMSPYIHIVGRGGACEVRGTSRFEVGRRIDLAGTPWAEPGYARWEWDGSKLTVANCQYGLRPLFYFVRHNEICVSSSLQQLLRQGAPTELDEAALAVFIRLGFFIGDDTPFRAIRAVPPNALFLWSPEAFQATERRPTMSVRRMSRDDAIDRFIELFQAAIARRPPGGPFAHPLSGGKDSRHILFALMRAGHRPDACVTARHFPPFSNSDEEIARQLAQELKLEHVVVPQRRSRVAAEETKNQLSGFSTLEHAWTLGLAECLAERTSVLYDGIAGDCLAEPSLQNSEGTKLAANGDFDALAEDLIRRFSGSSASDEVGLQHVLKEAVHERLGRALARDRLRQELSLHAGDPAPLRSFFFWSRVRRAISAYTFQILPSSINVICPFLDRDLFEFLYSLPAEVTVGQGFHTAAILRGYPLFSHIPFEDKRAFAVPTRAYTRRMALELLWTALRQRGSQLVNRSFFVPRVARCAIDGNERALTWIKPWVALYLLQLEEAIRQAAVGR